MSKRNKSKNKRLSVKTEQPTFPQGEQTPLQLVFSFLTAPVK